jgi:cyclin B
LVSLSSIKSKKSIAVVPNEIKEENNKKSHLNKENNSIVPLVPVHVSQKDKDINYLTTAREKNDSSQKRIFKRTLLIQSRNKDPSLCLDQIDRMYSIYHHLESIYAPGTYMTFQKDINHKMRSILVDWLIEVHHKFKLQQPTLWLTINLLDRYLEIVPTTRNKLQLVGVSALLIACKFEEIYPPEVKDCVYITGKFINFYKNTYLFIIIIIII